jgi:hypothetical protein
MQTSRDSIFLDTTDPALAVRRRVLARAFDIIWRLELPEKEIRLAVVGLACDSLSERTISNEISADPIRSA